MVPICSINASGTVTNLSDDIVYKDNLGVSARAAAAAAAASAAAVAASATAHAERSASLPLPRREIRKAGSDQEGTRRSLLRVARRSLKLQCFCCPDPALGIPLLGGSGKSTASGRAESSSLSSTELLITINNNLSATTSNHYD